MKHNNIHSFEWLHPDMQTPVMVYFDINTRDRYDRFSNVEYQEDYFIVDCIYLCGVDITPLVDTYWFSHIVKDYEKLLEINNNEDCID